jgi:SAM-dependent methyltransferase
MSPLPVPGPRSLLSDGRLVDRPLARADCEACGLGSHARRLRPAEVAAFFQEGYRLYAHEPGQAQERVRQKAYADWIVASVEARGLTDVVEVGCGNGSLLLELRGLLPSASLLGVEPSAEAARFARAAGVRVHPGFAEEAAPELSGYDLVIAVNVIEHSPDPARFLAALAAMAKPRGRIIVVCPEGSDPSTELLFFDHLWSITPAALAHFASRAGLAVERSSRAPASLGPFRLYVLSTRAQAHAAPAAQGLHAQRAVYLQAWKGLDDRLLERTESAGALSLFGAGEAALLLRAYAPGTWSRVRRVTVDIPTEEAFCGLPVVAHAALEIARGEVLLLAVRPLDQRRVAERLEVLWERLVRWDDVVAS